MDELEDAISVWSSSVNSVLTEHRNRTCCRIARSWFGVVARSGDGQGPPSWVSQMWTWGPLRWPAYWCDVLESRSLDCGALAAVATEACRSVGLTAYRTQAILEYSLAETDQWKALWSGARLAPSWIRGGLVYHEVVAIQSRASEHAVVLWDPAQSAALVPDAIDDGVVRAVRMEASVNGALANWHGNWLRPDEWATFTRPRVRPLVHSGREASRRL